MFVCFFTCVPRNIYVYKYVVQLQICVIGFSIQVQTESKRTTAYKLS